MPEPVPAPTPAQIVTVADIVMEPYDAVKAALSADAEQEVSDAKWELTLVDLTTYASQFGAGKQEKKSVGPLSWYQSDRKAAELAMVNKLRTRYGFERLMTLHRSVIDVSSLEWF